MKNKFRFSIAACLFCCIFLFAFNNRSDDDPVLNRLINIIQRWTDSIPQEKVYLHMDKPYYGLGDTIWFKGYLTIGSRHQLSALSGAMYVELINEKDSLLQRLKLPVTSGMVVGDFVLKDDYHQGSYRIRAYTQWMRNAGQDYFFDHTFLVGDVAGGNIIAKADFSYRDISGKKIFAALLNYTNDQGKALSERDVRYEIWVNHKPLLQQNAKTDALGSLRITIPDDISQHSEGAYIHTILEGSDKYQVTRDFPVKAILSQSDIQFLPESGNLVNGISSRVAFKAVGIDGLGIKIRGNIIDNNNQEVAKLETLHAGMGSFLLTPAAGKSYIAQVIFEDGSTKNIALPKALDEGYVLNVYQPNRDSILVRIHASAKLQPSAVKLIAHTNGEVIFATPIKIENPITSIWLEKKAFPSGIAQFTLFSNTGEPLNERIAFIRSNDIMQLEIKTNKTSYSSKEQVQVGLTAKGADGRPSAGNFSVSVIDESKVPFDESKESTIFSNLLLTSDLKGYVEQPNYYFAQSGNEVDKALDDLMLTQGYRRFAWKANAVGSIKPDFPKEGLGTVISGHVVTLNDKPRPVANANVSMVALRAKLFKSATTDAEGRFKFEPIFMTDSIKFSLQARTVQQGNKVSIILDTIPGVKVNNNPNLADVSLNIYSSLQQFLESGKKEDDIYEKLGMLDKVHRLKEVRIRGQKTRADTYSHQGFIQIPEGISDQTLIMPKNVQPCEGSLGTCLLAMLHGVNFRPFGSINYYPYAFVPQNHTEMPLQLFVDGQRITDQAELADYFDNNKIDIEQIAKIEVVRTSVTLLNILSGPALLIVTKKGVLKKRYDPDIVNITPKGFNKVYEFYSPRYDNLKANFHEPDLRTTIYWNPYLKTDAIGKASFNFYNADGPGIYKIVIEGINGDGQLCRGTYEYKIL